MVLIRPIKTTLSWGLPGPTLLSLKVNMDLFFWGGEDLGPILAPLAVLVIIIWISFRDWSYSLVQNPQIIEKYWDLAITRFWFRSTFNEGTQPPCFVVAISQLLGGRPWKPSVRYNLLVLGAGEGYMLGFWKGFVGIAIGRHSFCKHHIVFLLTEKH